MARRAESGLSSEEAGEAGSPLPAWRVPAGDRSWTSSFPLEVIREETSGVRPPRARPDGAVRVAATRGGDSHERPGHPAFRKVGRVSLRSLRSHRRRGVGLLRGVERSRREVHDHSRGLAAIRPSRHGIRERHEPSHRVEIGGDAPGEYPDATTRRRSILSIL